MRPKFSTYCEIRIQKRNKSNHGTIILWKCFQGWDSQKWSKSQKEEDGGDRREEEALDKGKKEIFSCNDFPIIVALSL